MLSVTVQRETADEDLQSIFVLQVHSCTNWLRSRNQRRSIKELACRLRSRQASLQLGAPCPFHNLNEQRATMFCMEPSVIYIEKLYIF